MKLERFDEKVESLFVQKSFNVMKKLELWRKNLELTLGLRWREYFSFQNFIVDRMSTPIPHEFQNLRFFKVSKSSFQIKSTIKNQNQKGILALSPPLKPAISTALHRGCLSVVSLTGHYKLQLMYCTNILSPFKIN